MLPFTWCGLATYSYLCVAGSNFVFMFPCCVASAAIWHCTFICRQIWAMLLILLSAVCYVTVILMGCMLLISILMAVYFLPFINFAPLSDAKNNSIMRAGHCHLSVQPFPAAFRVPNCTWLLSSPFSFLYIRNLALTCLSTSYSFNYGPITSALRVAHRHFSSALLV